MAGRQYRSPTRRRGRASGATSGNVVSRAGVDGPTPGSPADLTPDADPESVARTIVLRKLTAAPRTRAQLADDLARRDVPAEVADRVLDRFTEVGLVDDAAFAESWVRSRQMDRGLSRRALRHELRAKGVDDDTVSDAVASIDTEDEEAAARSLVDRRLPSTRGLPSDVRVRRLIGMLARKGYSSGLAFTVVRAALAAEAVDERD